MKAVALQTIISSIRAKTDGSLSLTLQTPELSVQDKVMVMSLQNVVCDALFQPQDEEFPEIHRVEGKVEGKTPSQRLRGALYVLWQKRRIEEDFEVWYRRQMDKIINQVKLKIEEAE